MNENEFDRTARTWLDDGPTHMCDRAVLAALDEIHRTRQRRVLWPAWKGIPVHRLARVAVAAILVMGGGLLAVGIVSRQVDRAGLGGQPTPSSAIDFPSLTMTFVSPRNGFSIDLPERVAIAAASQRLGGRKVDEGYDVVETGLGAVLKGTSTEVRDGVAIDAWVDGLLADDRVLPGGCGVRRSQQAEFIIDGRPGRISECPDRIEATVVADGRLYLFTLEHRRSDAQAVFDDFAATIDLTPDTAVDYPGLTTTFVSPTNGFSFGYSDRGEGTLTPATKPWDPINQPRPDNSGVHDDPFDVVETGLAAVLKSASTAIPDGVSIDAWVDEHVSVATCRVPRSQQAEITIDGQSGRISECPKTDEASVNQIEATVVAGSRLYLFILLSDRHEGDERAFFDAWVDTIDLTPETAAAPSTQPAP